VPIIGFHDTNTQLGGGFTYFLFSTLPGEDFQFDEHIFSDGLVIQPPTSFHDNDTKPWERQ